MLLYEFHLLRMYIFTLNALSIKMALVSFKISNFALWIPTLKYLGYLFMLNVLIVNMTIIVFKVINCASLLQLSSIYLFVCLFMLNILIIKVAIMNLKIVHCASLFWVVIYFYYLLYFKIYFYLIVYFTFYLLTNGTQSLLVLFRKFQL